MAVLREFGRLRKSSDRALSVPNLDGALKPNSRLDDAPLRASCIDPDNLIAARDAVYFSSGGTLLRLLPNGVCEPRETGPATITALASGPDGTIAIARSGEGITLVAPASESTRLRSLEPALGDVTAMSFLGARTLAVTIGARGRSSGEWQFDLMLGGHSGSVWVCDGLDEVSNRAEGLRYPAGVVADGAADLVVSTAWSSELIRVGPNGKIATVSSGLPGYPSRLLKATGAGFWLTMFAPRNSLVEFVLREKAFRDRMISEVEPEHWICPSLYPKSTPLDALQNGAQMVDGALKPWAPTFSYGMLVKLDGDFAPVGSFQSRANGHRHGITSVAEIGAEILATSRGSGAIVALPTHWSDP